MIETRLTRMLGIRHPILSGGMMRVSRAELVAPVAEAGAFVLVALLPFLRFFFLRSERSRLLPSSRAPRPAPLTPDLESAIIDVRSKIRSLTRGISGNSTLVG